MCFSHLHVSLSATCRSWLPDKPIAAVTNYHKCSDLREHNVSSCSSGPWKFKLGHWAKIRHRRGLSWEWKVFPRLSQFRGAACVPSFSSKASGVASANLSPTPTSASVMTPSPTLTPPTFTYQDTRNDLGPTPVIQDNLPISRAPI